MTAASCFAVSKRITFCGVNLDSFRLQENRVLSPLSSKKILEKILSKPFPVIFGIALVSLFFAFQVPRLSFVSSVYDLVIEDLPENARYREFKKIFGSDEIIRVVLKGDNVYDPQIFAEIERFVAAAAQIEGVRRVISLPGVKKAVDLAGKWTLDKFRQVIAPIDLFQKNLIAANGKSTAITLILKRDADKEKVMRAVDELMANAAKTLSLYQIGMPLVSRALAVFTEKDFFRLPPITFLIIGIILLCIFRNLTCVILPLVCVSLALVWTFGFMALIGIPLSMVTMIVPVFLLAVGTAYCLHICAEYLRCRRDALTSTEAAYLTFSHISFPTVLAVLTTVIALGSLLVNRIKAIQEFAILACFGILSLLVILLLLFPAVLALIPLSKNRPAQKDAAPRLVDNFLNGVIRLNLKHQPVILSIIAVITLICGIGILQVRVETNPVGFFKKDIPVSRHFHDIYKDLSGSFPINVMVAASEEDYFENAQHIADIARFSQTIGQLPGVDKTISFADYLKLVNYVLNRFDAKFYTLPEEDFEVRMLINTYKTLLGEDMLTRFVSRDFSKANILLLTHISSSNDFLQIRDKIAAIAAPYVGERMQIDVTGFGIVVSASSKLLTIGQIKSLSITMIVVFGIMFLLFLSSKVGFIAIVPNLFPIIINFGIMGWFGIELSMATSLIASIAIGLAVDDTIHYLVRYNKEFKKDLNEEHALKTTLLQMGRPIIYTTLTISVGFSILAFSSFKPTAVFGIMMVIIMLSALVGDLILLPSLMLHAELVTLWDLVRLKLGREPRHVIPLFKGLSRAQVHYIIMAGSLRKLDSGQVLFEKGDASDSMYAIISGELDVIDPMEGGEPTDTRGSIYRLIQRLVVGDVVGEMGLLRARPRSATVVACNSSELLEINLKMIKRLQWLYPPTAQKFFFNLMTILCDRLENATHNLAATCNIDDLTHLCNRKSFLDYLGIEIYRSSRFKQKLALCLMEVGFTAANPQNAFELRDQVLTHISEILNTQTRKIGCPRQAWSALLRASSAQHFG
jgi:predicted RND superfamily exporter protein/CRP-like cAMP-binding protein